MHRRQSRNHPESFPPNRTSLQRSPGPALRKLRIHPGLTPHRTHPPPTSGEKPQSRGISSKPAVKPAQRAKDGSPRRKPGEKAQAWGKRRKPGRKAATTPALSPLRNPPHIQFQFFQGIIFQFRSPSTPPDTGISLPFTSPQSQKNDPFLICRPPRHQIHAARPRRDGYSLFPIPYSLFPIPCSLFPVPCAATGGAYKPLTPPLLPLYSPGCLLNSSRFAHQARPPGPARRQAGGPGSPHHAQPRSRHLLRHPDGHRHRLHALVFVEFLARTAPPLTHEPRCAGFVTGPGFSRAIKAHKKIRASAPATRASAPYAIPANNARSAHNPSQPKTQAL